MRLPSIKLAPCLLALATVTASLPAMASTPRVGYWAGESVTPCVGSDPTTCPRDLSSFTPELWTKLKAENSFIYLDLIYGSDFGPTLPGVARRTDAMAIIQEANLRGVSISAWITMPLSYGTFANEENASAVSAAVKAFAQWKTANNLQFDQAVLDQEFPLGFQFLMDAFQGNQVPLKNQMVLNLNPAGQCAAATIYRDTITWAHQNGLKLSSAPVLLALDDLKDGNTALQDAMNMTAFPPFGYDEQYFQAYRADGPLDLGSGLVAAWYTEMQQKFGAKGQVTLGSVGQTPYTTAAPIVADVRMLAAMGATTIPIFDLDQAVKTLGLAGIQQIFDAAHNPMNATELAAAKQMTSTGNAFRSFLQGLDAYATYATPWATAAAWNPQQPNSYPNGCGNMTASP